MTKDEHRERHKKLHQALDELLADFIIHTGKRVSNSTCMELMEWSHTQTKNPTENNEPPHPSTEWHAKPFDVGDEFHVGGTRWIVSYRDFQKKEALLKEVP